MKRFLLLIIFLTLVVASAIPAGTVFAERSAIDKKVDEFLPTGVVQENSSQALPSGDLQTDILPRLVKILLQLVGSISFIVFVYAGVMLIVAQGNEEDVTKFKNILLWSAVGLTFITTAYALVSGILKIVFK